MKKILSVLLTAVITFNLAVFTAAADIPQPRDLTANNKMAADLKELGLFRGVSATDFDLERAPSRTEALVILIRLLGKESSALNGKWEHPFTDVASWADRYVGYAYENGLTNGISATEFGTSDANAATFLTFVLRALGYSDAGGADFTWDDPFSLAKEIGILTEDVNTDTFWRADAVTVSYNALSANIKDSNGTLAKKLIADGAFTNEQYSAVFGIGEQPADTTAPADTEASEETAEPAGVETTAPSDTESFESTNSKRQLAVPEDEKRPYSPSPIEAVSSKRNKKVLTAKEAYDKCSPFVFSVTTYDIGGNVYATASGFLLNSDGLAVTNLHVFSGALSATVTFNDGTVCEVEGVVGVDTGKDCILIQLKGSHFPTPSLGDSDDIETGDPIFTIGNPMGLSETISTGIISNVSREDYNGFIQITAPISPGSSGGALINEYGEVIGITAGTLTSSQNLNFAVPINVAYELYDQILDNPDPNMVSLNFIAWLTECMRMTTISQPFKSTQNETEPNNTPEEAEFLANSKSVIGVVYNGDTDSYLVRCSCDGTVTVLLMCPSIVLAMGKEDANGRTMADFRVELKDPKTGEVISIGEIIKDETTGMEMVGMMTFKIPKPGIYEINVSVKDTVQSSAAGGLLGNIVIYDYVAYFLFVPDVEMYTEIVE